MFLCVVCDFLVGGGKGLFFAVVLVFFLERLGFVYCDVFHGFLVVWRGVFGLKMFEVW